jgi:hypothetical protein
MLSFPFRFAHTYRLASFPFGVHPGNCEVRVTGDEVVARFGFWTVRTPLSNIKDTRITRDYAFVKAAGPARLSFADRGLTFATNGDEGLCLCFHEPVRGIDPAGLLRHPGLTVTVADCAGLQAAIRAAG